MLHLTPFEAASLPTVRTLCRRLDARITPEQVKAAWASIDADGSGGTDFDEFRAWWVSPAGRALRNEEDETPSFTYKELIAAVAARKEARLAKECEEKEVRRARLAADREARKERKAARAAERAARKAEEDAAVAAVEESARRSAAEQLATVLAAKKMVQNRLCYQRALKGEAPKPDNREQFFRPHAHVCLAYSYTCLWALHSVLDESPESPRAAVTPAFVDKARSTGVNISTGCLQFRQGSDANQW
eukprot:SAG31_NODE_5831_length_2304_cov_1.903401_4_plen_247_part_00